jgi:hypothetical protein
MTWTKIDNVFRYTEKVDNIEYENIKNLTSKKWLQSGELEPPNLKVRN